MDAPRRLVRCDSQLSQPFPSVVGVVEMLWLVRSIKGTRRERTTWIHLPECARGAKSRTTPSVSPASFTTTRDLQQRRHENGERVRQNTCDTRGWTGRLRMDGTRMHQNRGAGRVCII